MHVLFATLFFSHHTHTADGTIHAMIYSARDVAAGPVSYAVRQMADQSLSEYVLSNFNPDHVLTRLVSTYQETLGDDALKGRSLEILDRVLRISVRKFSPQMPGAECSSPSAGQQAGSFTRESSDSSCARTSKQPARSSRRQALADITNTHYEANSSQYDPAAVQSQTEDTDYEELLAQYEQEVSQPPKGQSHLSYFVSQSLNLAESHPLSKEQIETYLSNLIERPWAKETVRGHQPDKSCNLCTLVCRPGHESVRWTNEDLVASDEAETEHWLTRQRVSTDCHCLYVETTDAPGSTGQHCRL